MRNADVHCAMPRAQTGQQKVPTLKKTTGLCPSRCCYSMLCCKSRMVPSVCLADTRFLPLTPSPPLPPTLFAIELPFVENHAGFSDLLQRLYSQTSSPSYYFHIYCQSRARFNTAATTRPCFQANKLLSVVLCPYSLWLLHRGHFSYFFLSLKLHYVVALSLLGSL